MISLKNKKILIVAPHPDDEAICAGGLIMQAKKQKAKVHVLFMAIGESRQFITGSTERNERQKEAARAAKYGNYTYTFAFIGDAFMRLDSLPQKDLIEKIEDECQKFRPEIVVIPSQSSFDQDHRATASACITALRPLPADQRHQVSIILECEEPYTWGTKPFNPNFFVDISDVFEEKIKLLTKHTTQLRSDPFPRSPDNLRRLAGFRGCEASVKYAESYNLLKGKI